MPHAAQDPHTPLGQAVASFSKGPSGETQLHQRSGGQGNVSGTLLGVLILGVLENGVSFFQVPIEVKHILIGAIIIVNTALSRWQRGRSE